MDAQDFVAFQEFMRWNNAETARQFGLSRNSVLKYQKEGAPKSIGLAAAAIAFGLPAWKAVTYKAE